MIDSMTTDCTIAARNIDAPQDEPKIGKYELLLFKIATSFGFSNKESSDIVQQVHLDRVRHFRYQENGNQIRVLLSKMMVQRCIFKISSEYFSSVSSNPGKEFSGLAFYPNCISLRLRNFPLSLRTVVILNSVGFDETEIAQILNTTPFIVKEKFNKALVLINNHH